MWAPITFSLIFLLYIFLPLLFHFPQFNNPNMMHHCGSASGGASSFSVFLSVPNHGGGGARETVDTYSNHSSSVDCTLSLGTPSTRSSEIDSDQRAAGSYVSNFCWDLLHPRHKSTGRCGGGINNAAAASGGNPLVARRCANCDTTSTPLWRNGPRGPKSLCNACGIRFKKEERRAAATVNITAAESNNLNTNSNTTWVPHHSPLTTQKLPCVSPAAVNSESMFVGNETENGMSSFLSWRLNVTDHRPSLVHDFTR